MTALLRKVLIGVVLLAPSALGYIRGTTSAGTKLAWPNPANIQFQVYVAGANIATGYDVKVKLQAAMTEWATATSRSTVSFAPLTDAPMADVKNDGVNRIIVGPTAYSQSLFACPGSRCNVAATTMTSYDTTSGAIKDADIILNPNLAWGPSPGYSDIQKVVRHELGHALGANHSAVFETAMWPSSGDRLSWDERAFLVDAYPKTGARSLFARIHGILTYTDGTPVKFGLITASGETTESPAGGAVVQTLTGADGSYDFYIPPGGYYAVTHRVQEFLSLSSLGLSQADNFPTCMGGGFCLVSDPLAAAAGDDKSLSRFNAAKGTPWSVYVYTTYARQGLNRGSSYGSPIYQFLFPGDQNGELWVKTMDLSTGAPVSQVGQPQFLLFMPEMKSAGSPTYDAGLKIGPGWRMPLNLDKTTGGWTSLLLVDTSGLHFAIFPGGIYIQPSLTRGDADSGPVNAASLNAGPLAPGSIATWKSDLIASAEQSVDEPASTLGGVSVSVIDGDQNTRAASLTYVSPVQINFIMPENLRPGPAVVLVTKSDGSTIPFTTKINPVAPGLFSANGDGRGPAVGTGFRVSTPSDADGDPSGNQASVQLQLPFLIVRDAPVGYRTSLPIDLSDPFSDVYLTLLGTGFRNTGGMAQPILTIGGQSVPVTKIEPGATAGVDQVTVGPLPRSLARSGDVDIVLTTQGMSSNAVQVTIR